MQTTPEQDESLGGEYATLKVTTSDQDTSDSSQPRSPVSPQSGRPKKPPRTFAHDDYVVQKQLRHKRSKALKDARKVTEVIQEVQTSPKIDPEGYEIVDIVDSGNSHVPILRESSKPGVMPAMDTNKYHTIHKIPNGEVKRPGERPPPPPRPPPPSPRSSVAGSDPQRWQKPHINVKQHNKNLPKAAFLGKGKMSNPSYEADWDIIRIKTPNCEGENLSSCGMKRSKSDECLYAEPVTHAYNEPIYCDPIDVVKKSNHHVIIDAEGYAIPEHRKTPSPRPSCKPLQRMVSMCMS
jgi:hypothetical protein